MKRYMMILMTLVGMMSMAHAQGVDGTKVDRSGMERSGDYMAVNMNIDLTALDVESNRAVLLTPIVVNGDNQVELPSIGIYGRNRYYYYVRNDESMLTGKTEQSYRASEKPASVEIKEVVPYQEWMDGSQLVLRRQDYGCCGSILAEQTGNYAGYNEPVKYEPVFAYVRPQAETVKSRSLSGSAYIDFPVNQTVIRSEYRKNQLELDKIQGTINSVKDDADMTITAIAIKGYASPEGSYAANERLAKGRTEALKNYVQNLYHFDASIMKTDYEPEDWAGLEAYVQKSSLEHKEEILAIIDSEMTPDKKDQAIKQRFPADYRSLLTDCYPALRHSDYEVDYIIRSYTSVDEIKRIFRDSPQKLSLQEFYQLAQEYESGSPAFNQVYETAVRMYPEDAHANLNAANAAMGKGDLSAAEGYLKKAGNMPESVYARGVHAALTQNYPAALQLFKQAQSQGVSQAVAAIEIIEKMK